MHAYAYPILSYLVFFPLLAALLLAFFRSEQGVRVFTLEIGRAHV